MEEYIGQRGEADRVLDHVEFVVVARESLLTILLMSFLISISVFLIVLFIINLRENKVTYSCVNVSGGLLGHLNVEGLTL